MLFQVGDACPNTPLAPSARYYFSFQMYRSWSALGRRAPGAERTHFGVLRGDFCGVLEILCEVP